jgi:hypothetical protein
MRVFIIDTRNMGPELQGGLIGVVGSTDPSPEEKQECVDTVARYAVDGWAIAADSHTPIGRLAALTAETACVPFVRLEGSRLPRRTARNMMATDGPEQDPADVGKSPFPAWTPEAAYSRHASTDSRIGNGGL